MNNKDILEKVERIVEIGNIKERRIVEDIFSYEFKKRNIETRKRENKDKLSLRFGIIEFLNDLSLLKETPIETYMENAMINSKIPAETQYKIGTKIVDFAYQEQRLAVECDGYKWHKYDKEQIENDIERDKYLAKKGWRILHFSGVQIRRNIEGCINEIKEALFIERKEAKGMKKKNEDNENKSFFEKRKMRKTTREEWETSRQGIRKLREEFGNKKEPVKIGDVIKEMKGGN